MPGLLRKCLFISLFSNVCSFLIEISYTLWSSTQTHDGVGQVCVSLLITIGSTELHWSNMSVLVLFFSCCDEMLETCPFTKSTMALCGIIAQEAGKSSKNMMSAPERKEKGRGSHSHSSLEQNILWRTIPSQCLDAPSRYLHYPETLKWQHMHFGETHANQESSSKGLWQPFSVQL